MNTNGNNISSDLSKLFDDFKTLQCKQNELFCAIDTVNNMKSKMDDYMTIFESFKNKCSDLFEMEAKVNQHDTQIESLVEETESLSDKYDKLQRRFNTMEMYTYQANVEITGVQMKKSENVVEIFDIIAKHIQFNYNKSDIRYIHRVQSRRKSKPIIIEFMSKFLKDDFLKKASLVSEITNAIFGERSANGDNSLIYIQQHMPAWRKKLLMNAKELRDVPYDYKYVWSKYGKIFVKKDDNSPTVSIYNFEQLNTIKSREDSERLISIPVINYDDIMN